MPPNQIVPPVMGGPNPYDFITQDPQKPKRSLLPSGGSRKQRLLIVGAIFVVVFILFAIIMSLIFNSGSTSTERMLQVAQTQTEIARVSTTGLREIRSASVQDFAQNTSSTISSQQQQTIANIAQSRKAPAAKELALKQSSATDQALEDAALAGQYDQTFYTILYEQLTDYRTELEQAYNGTNSTSQRQLLQSFYQQINDLLKNQPATSS